MTTPRIYVASLADYNNAHLHGVWIDADQDTDTIREEIATMLRASRHPNVTVECPEPFTQHSDPFYCETCKGTGKVPSAEEYAIHDHEGFEGIEIGEFTDLETVVLHGQMLAKHDGAWAAYVGLGITNDPTEGDFEEKYRGTFRTVADYAEQLVEDCYDLEKTMGNLACYFDYERFARDLELGGDICTVSGGDGVYVFDNH